MYMAGRSVLHLTRGEHAEAVGAARDALAFIDEVGVAAEPTKESLVAALEAGARLGDADVVEEFLAVIEAIPRGKLPPYLHAHAERFRGWLAANRGEHDAVEQFLKSSAGLFREIEAPFHMAVALLEHGEGLVARGRSEDARGLLQEARGVFERLAAKPWVERLDRVAQEIGVMA